MALEADKQTLDLIEKIKKRESEIAALDRPSWRTNCSFSYQEGTAQAVNIQVEASVRNLILIAAFLLDKEKSYRYGAANLNVESPPALTWNGYPICDWIGDLKLRIAKIQIAAKRKKLADLKERLNKIISPELRAQMELEAIASEL